MASSPEDNHTSSKRPKRTPCTNCRQQKAKCDAEPGSGKPCSRCAKLNANCVVSNDFKREMKRRRVEPDFPLEGQTSTGIPTPQASSDDRDASDGPTLPRTLDKVTLDSATIDSLFDTYHPYLPILDPQTLPNAYFARCPLTFFAILSVAAQKNNPELTSTLTPSVHNLAMISIKAKNNYHNSIHAILLILTWPLSRLPDNDLIFPLAASLLHMAMSIGLHIPFSTVEFNKLGSKMTEDDLVHRATLWAQCQIAYARCSAWKGITAFMINQRLNDKATASKVPPSLRFHRRAHETVTKFFEAAQDVGLKAMGPEQDRSLGVLINVFDERLKDIADEPHDEIDQVYVATARLQIIVFHFFRNQDCVSSPAKATVYNTACSIITTLQRLDNSTQLASVAPFYMACGLLIASHILLRMCKTLTESWFNFAEAEKFLMDAIDLCKRMSKDRNDMCNRCAYRLTQLWQSKRAYRKSDGSRDFEMRARNRHALSIILDAMWRWREEFEDAEHPCPPNVGPPPPEGSANATDPDFNGGQLGDLSNVINDQFLFDFGFDMVDFNQEWMTMPDTDQVFGS